MVDSCVWLPILALFKNCLAYSLIAEIADAAPALRSWLMENARGATAEPGIGPRQ